MDYSTAKISSELLQEISSTLAGLDWGSIEIYVQDSTIVQITRRQIKKTQNPSRNKSAKLGNYSLTNK